MSKPGNTEVTNNEAESVKGGKKMKLILDRAKDQSKLCPVRDVIHRISDKWSLLSILAVFGDTLNN